VERNVQRINGELVRLHRLSDDEIESYMSHAHDRIEGSVRDLEHLGVESARRFCEEQDVAFEGLAKVIQFPGQGTLFEMPDNIA
jgi:hypothetical protein